LSRYPRTRECRRVVSCLALLFALPLLALPDAPAVAVQLEVGKAGPRRVETETERRIAAGYRLAWANLAQALASSDTGPLDALFVGQAKQWLQERVNSQKQSGLSTRYSNQHHQLQAIFYSPEGDVIELHDTAEYQTEMLDGDKRIHSDRESHHFVVLMTPASDRWVIRQLLEVPQF